MRAAARRASADESRSVRRMSCEGTMKPIDPPYLTQSTADAERERREAWQRALDIVRERVRIEEMKWDERRRFRREQACAE